MTSWAAQRYPSKREIQLSLDDHLTDASAAHAASAISVADSGGLLTATDVEAALAEIAGEVDTNTAGIAAISQGSWVEIEKGFFGNLGSELATKTWSSLTYRAYRLRLYVNQYNASDTVFLRCNGDTGNNYTIGGGLTSQLQLGGSITNNEHAVIEIEVWKPSAAQEAFILGKWGVLATVTSMSSSLIHGSWRNTSSLITSLTVRMNASGLFGSVTYYVLEGLDDTS